MTRFRSYRNGSISCVGTGAQPRGSVLEREELRRLRGLFVCGFAFMMVLAISVVGAPGARAASLTSTTLTIQGATFPPMPVGLFPCTTETGNVTLTDVNALFHLNFNKAGDGWFTATFTGSFTFAPDAPGTVTYAGNVTDWFGFNANLQNFETTGTLNIHNAIGSDGSTVSAHFTTTLAFTPAEIASGSPPVVNMTSGVCGT
jgi:hypothetical protein